MALRKVFSKRDTTAPIQKDVARPEHDLKLIQVFQKNWRHSGVFIVNFEQILHILVEFPLLTLNK